MKPPQFEYDDPRTLDEALSLLAQHGDDAKVLAGGQSLVPLLNFRLARPERLIDVNGIGELSYIRRKNGVLRVGALTRQSTLERSSIAASEWPLLIDAVRLVGHAQIRNRGTVGGSVAHADPSAELPVAFAALDARFHVRSQRGTRTLDSEQLFVTQLTTSLEPDELLVEVEVPAQAPGTGWAFTEFARRHGDFALGGAAVLLRLDESGACTAAEIGLLAAGPTPLLAREAAAGLVGARVDEDAAQAAAERAVEGIQPTGDIHGSSAYRRDVIRAMVRRAVVKAAERATRQPAQ
jgi:CO/xanthine dehydrogenase FAD-binding subunit